jgi:hypothetical protein
MMRRQERGSLCLLVAVATALAGCVGMLPDGPLMADVYRELQEPGSDSGRVIFVRSSDDRRMVHPGQLHVNGAAAVEIQVGACDYRDLAPGLHTLRLDVKRQFGHHEIQFNLAPSSQRYFMLQPRDAAVTAAYFGALGMIERLTAEASNDGILELVELSEDQAVRLFARCNYIGDVSP